MPPSYGSQEYWNHRFTNESEPFEWLQAPHALDSFVIDALQHSAVARPRFLHIGCGTSRLSHHLQTLVHEAGQIHNVNYSEVAIELGRDREQELRTSKQASATDADSSSMRWDAIDLLSHNSVLQVCKPSTYSIIIDKSTSDAISCSDDVHVPLPYAIDIDLNYSSEPELRQSPEALHPLHVLAVHLALITLPGARWIALSYSNDRFPFAGDLHSSRPYPAGFPDTATLWKLLEKRELESIEVPLEEQGENGITHRPKVLNWVYILERTTVPLHVRGAHV